MLYILVSFTPWIIYWVLCGYGFEYGLIVSYIASLTIAVAGFLRRSIYLMDMVSLIFFTIATIYTYLTGSNLFIVENGFLGYMTLFIMAVLSIVVKKPYTLQVSKHDYPEIYWRDKSFLMINNIITLAWSIIFLANALIYLYNKTILSIILTNALIAVGVVFSTIFPIIAPAYSVSKRFKKYDWRVEVKPGESRDRDEYDVIIVGSGIGGLTCGALLAKNGYRVLVLEQHYQVGGYCSSFSKKGFVFNTGVENVSGLWERGPVRYLLKELGLSVEDYFVKNRMRFIYKDRSIDVNSFEDFIEKLIELYPEERNGLESFFNEARYAYEECYSDLDYGVPLPAELIVKVYGARELLDYPRKHPHFYDWMNKTYREKLDEFLRNEDLKKLLCALIGYVGAEPDKISASTALTAIVSYYLHGGYYPKGGAGSFANALKKYIEDHGGTVYTRHKVDKVIVVDGEVRGVKVGDKVFRSRVVVANVNAKTLFEKLVDHEHVDRDYLEYIDSLKMSPSCFMVFLGVDMDLSNYPTIIENLDEGYSLVINSNADPSLAPIGMSSVTILTLANYHEYPDRGSREYVVKKKMVTEEMIKRVEKIIPGISKHIVVLDSATPKTFERYTSMPEGAIYGFDQTIYTRRPYFKTPIKGLYLAGSSTFPGGGIEAVVISGIICAYDIIGWRNKSKK